MLLVVDDDPDFLQDAEEILGRRVLFAGDADQAKGLMTMVGAAFSVVLIDLDLPGQDGFSLIRDFHENFPDLPLLAISGVVSSDVLETAKLVGATDVLRKPITPAWANTIARVTSKLVIGDARHLG